MSENKNLTLLKVTLFLFAIMAVIYGIVYIFFTEAYIANSGSEPIHPSWLRWFGGIFLALAHGAVLVLRNPSKQDIFVKTCAYGTLFIGLLLLYTFIFEMQPEDSIWYTAMPAFASLVLSALLWWGRHQARDILKKG